MYCPLGKNGIGERFSTSFPLPNAFSIFFIGIFFTSKVNLYKCSQNDGFMRQLKCNKHDEFVEWRFKNFYAIGVIGICDSPLENWSNYLNNSTFEFFPIKNEKYRDFLAVFSFNPILDISVAHYHKNKETSIVSYGLDEEKSRKIVDELAERASLIKIIPSISFVNQISMEVEKLNVPTYLLCEEIAVKTGNTLEKILGRIYYANSLIRYKGLSDDLAMKLAEKRFSG